MVVARAIRPVGLLASLVLLSALATPSLAQDLTGPVLAPPSATLYAHSADSAGTLWMSTVKEDEDATDDTISLASIGDVQCSGSAAFPMLPVLDRDVILDATVDIQFNIRFGVGSGAFEGTVSTTLASGTTPIASGSADVGPTASAGGLPAGYGDVKITAKAGNTLLASGAPLVWTISFEGLCSSAFLQVGQGGNFCNLVLPISGVGAGPAPAANATGNATGNSTVDANATSNATSNTTGNATQPASNKTSTAKSNTTSNTTSSTAPANDTLDSDEASTPVPAPVLLAPAVAAALLRRRRNRLDP